LFLPQSGERKAASWLIKYRSEIDGLRAFAVIPVMFFHLGFPWMAGGYIGVDVFFVISGFLITSIIKSEFETNTFSFREFWGRRIRRIMPVLVVVVTSTLATAYGIVFRPEMRGISKQALATLACFANIYFYRTAGDYWGTKAEESPFLHMWSLSVEEQFYFIFPVCLWLIHRFRRRAASGFVLGVMILSYALFLFGANFHRNATFFLLPTRAWELMTGCYLALRGAPDVGAFISEKWRARLATAALGIVTGSYFMLGAFSGWLSVPVIGTAMVIAFSQSGWANRILSQPFVVHIGKLSYSLYLWHWPVLVFAKYLGVGEHPIWLLIPIYGLSFLSYNLVERSTRRRARLIPAILGTYAVTTGLAMWMTTLSPWYDSSGFDRVTYVSLDCHPHPPDGEARELRFGTTQVIAAESSPRTYLEGGILTAEQGDPEVVVIGDSHGTMWSGAIRDVVDKLGMKTSFYCLTGVSPFISTAWSQPEGDSGLSVDEQRKFDSSRRHFISKWKPRLVILCTRWSIRSEAETKDLMEFLEANAAKVLLIEQPPELGIGSRNAVQYLCYRHVLPEEGIGKRLPDPKLSEYETGRQIARTVAAKYKNTEFLEINDLYCDESGVLVLDGRRIVYLDADHLVSHGTRLAMPRLERAISRLARTDDEAGAENESARAESARASRRLR
jgi:peptidoglycan/LPS O-acetylase OafA/YrhL